jgi:integrase
MNTQHQKQNQQQQRKVVSSFLEVGDTSLYKYGTRLKRYRYNIGLLPNGEVALRFLDHLGALGLSVGRISKYGSHLPPLLRVLPSDLAAVTRTDMEGVVSAINCGNFTEWTKHDKKLTLRKLVQYAKLGSCARDTPWPPEVSWIRLNVKEKNFRVTPEGLLTEDDFSSTVKATTNKRDRAMVYVLFEAALRPGELLTMYTSSVVFKEGYCLITANGKTGIKRIPLVVSVKPLLEWLEVHPFRDESDAPLWCALSRNANGGRHLSYRHFQLLIKKITRRANLRKDIWPYLFRHTALTSMAKVFTESKLEQFAGWIHGSKMSRRYVHFSARDLEDAVLELHGLKPVATSKGLVQFVECPRCSNKDPLGNVRCSVCGMVVDKELAFELEAVERQKEKDLVEKNAVLQQRLEKLEGVILDFLQSQGKSSAVPV